MNGDAKHSGTKTYMTPLRLAVLVLAAVIIVWLGVSWRYAWFPFASQNTSQQMVEQNDTTATGPSTLTPAEEAALIKNTTATKPSTLSPAEDQALIDATSAR